MHLSPAGWSAAALYCHDYPNNEQNSSRWFRTHQPERWHVHRNQNIFLIQRWNHFIALNILFKALNGWTSQHWLTVVLTFETNLLPFNQKQVEFSCNKSAEWIAEVSLLVHKKLHRIFKISFVKTWDALVDQLTSFWHISIYFATVCCVFV